MCAELSEVNAGYERDYREKLERLLKAAVGALEA